MEIATTHRSGAVTPLMTFYALFAAAGAIVPWWFNIQYMRQSKELLTPQAWVLGGSSTRSPAPSHQTF